MGEAMSEPMYTLLNFDDLVGWSTDDHEAALTVFSETCGDMKDPIWQSLSVSAKSAPAARAFFEAFFHPVMIEDGEPMLFTGYYEPEFCGSKVPDNLYKYPIYSLPADLVAGKPYLSRQQIEEKLALSGRGLEIAWLSDPVDRFFLQVQGSGRIRLSDGAVIRVGYAGKNGREYSSVGQELVRRGTYKACQISAHVIRNWVHNNPKDGRELFWLNKSYIFFREINDVPFDKGPLGAMNKSITMDRSIAVDPKFTTLGTPIWIEKAGTTPINRLVIAQDTGSAITGAQRADIFYGTGENAGLEAGRINDTGRMIHLLPTPMVHAISLENIL